MIRDPKIGRRAVLPAVLLVLMISLCMYTAVGCGGRDGSSEATGTTTGSLEDSIIHPAGATEVVLRVTYEGGLVPVSSSLSHVPEFTLYGDGTVIVSGPVIAIYPGPAMPNLQAARISEDSIQAILSAARDAGLFASGVDYGQPGITDVATTTIIINAEGDTYRSDIYALGMEPETSGLTPAQQQAREAVGDLTGKLYDLTAFEPGEIGWGPYEYSALAVYSIAVDASQEPGPDDVQPNQLEWPLDDLASLGEPVQPEGYRRAVVSRDDLATLRPLLSEATQITVWTAGDREYNLHFRPLLPDESI